MDYKEMKIVELRVLAKERGVKSTTTLNKKGLIEALEALDRQAPEPVNPSGIWCQPCTMRVQVQNPLSWRPQPWPSKRRS